MHCFARLIVFHGLHCITDVGIGKTGVVWSCNAGSLRPVCGVPSRIDGLSRIDKPRDRSPNRLKHIV